VSANDRKQNSFWPYRHFGRGFMKCPAIITLLKQLVYKQGQSKERKNLGLRNIGLHNFVLILWGVKLFIFLEIPNM